MWIERAALIALVGAGTACGALASKGPEKPKAREAIPLDNVASFPDGEPIVVDLIAKKEKEPGSSYGPPVKVHRAYIMDKGWELVRYPNGDPKSRRFTTTLYFQSSAPWSAMMTYDAGTCYYALCVVSEKENGGSWTDPKFSCGTPEEDTVLTCDSIDRLPKGVEPAASE